MLITLSLIALGALPRVAVLNLETSGIEASQVPILSEVLVTEVAQASQRDVVSGRDIQAILGYEATRQSLGCDETACLAEIGGALGAELLLAAQVAKLDDTFVVNVKLIETQTMQSRARTSERTKGDLDAVLNAMRDAVWKAFTQRDYEHRHIGALGLGRPGLATGIAGGLALVLAGVGGGFGYKAQGHHANATNPSYVGAQLEIERGTESQRYANIGYGLAATAALTSLVFYLFVDSDLGWEPSQTTTVGQ